MRREFKIKNQLSKEEVDELMRVSGNVKGVVFQTHAAFIRYKEGEKGIKMVEERLKELGYPLKFTEISSLAWYPEALSILVVLTAKEVFKWKDSDIFNMGNSAPKYSLIARMLVKTFISIKKVFEESPKYWKKHYDFGVLESYEINEKEKYVMLRLKEYKLHPTVCIYFCGYFYQIAQYVVRSKKITIEETKCVYRGGPYHEFLIKWK